MHFASSGSPSIAASSGERAKGGSWSASYQTAWVKDEVNTSARVLSASLPVTLKTTVPTGGAPCTGAGPLWKGARLSTEEIWLH